MASGTRGRPSIFERLYTGTGAFDIVGRRKMWYVVFGIIVTICLGSIIFRGFHLGIDFEGGTQIQFPVGSTAVPATPESVKQVVTQAAGEEPESVQTAGQGAAQTIQIRMETLTPAQLLAVKQALFDTFQPVGPDGAGSATVISDSDVSGTWGGQITRQAMIALAVFLVLVTIFLGFYFERAMAIAALIALIHDVVVTAGIYSIVGFEVTPATIIGLLTILGFSLYDTVVVFDKVTENTRGILGLTRRTYAEAANLALNQTLMRSINTSLIAVLPVIGLLVIGVGLLGVGTLADLALVQMVGILAGAASSILLATPVLVDLKLRDKRFRDQAARVYARRAKLAGRAAAADAASADAVDGVEDTSDEALAAELRREKAVAAAAAAPARHAAGRRPAPRSARPSGKSSRPSGKRHR